MEMISPDSYIKQKKKLTVEELRQEKLSLQAKIDKIKEDIANDVPDVFNGGRDTKLKMYQEYLSKLDELLNKN